MQKFEKKFHVLGKGGKFLGWVLFRLPFEAPGRFQIQRESREKWIGMEKTHDGSALTDSFMRGLSGLLHKEQHHVFEAWVCIKQTFWRALWDHRILKVGKSLQDLQFQPSSASSGPRGCFSHLCFVCLPILCGIPRGFWIITPRDVFPEHGWCGKSFGVQKLHVVTLSCPHVVPLHHTWAGSRNHLRYGQPTDEPPGLVR